MARIAAKKPVVKAPVGKPKRLKKIAPGTLKNMRQRTAEKVGERNRLFAEKVAERRKLRLEKANRRAAKLYEYDLMNQESKAFEAKYGKVLNNLRKKKIAKAADKERFTPKISLAEADRSKSARSTTQKSIAALKERINAIDNAYKHLESQKHTIDNAMPHKGMLIEFTGEAKTQRQLKARGNREGVIVSEKQYKDMLRRNRLAHQTAVNELNRAEFLYSFKRQERWLSGKNIGGFKEAHTKAINALAQRYERGQISGDALKKFMSVLDSSVKQTINQHRVLAKTKGTTYFDDHARVAGKALLSFMKEANLKNFDKAVDRLNYKMSALGSTLDTPKRAVELEMFYRKF